MADITEIRVECPGCGSTGGVTCGNCSDFFYDTPLCDADLEAILAQNVKPLIEFNDEHKAMLDELLRVHEHDTHKLAREDYTQHDGRNWRDIHQRHNTELFLRQRFGLPEHPFGKCCESPVEPEPVAAGPKKELKK